MVLTFLLPLNDKLMFEENGTMIYDDQLYYEIQPIDKEYLFFTVTFAGEHTSEYIFNSKGEEVVDFNEMTEFPYIFVTYDNGYLVLESTSEDLMDIYLNEDGYCLNTDKYSNELIGKRIEKFKYTGNGEFGKPIIVSEKTIKEEMQNSCSYIN